MSDAGTFHRIIHGLNSNAPSVGLRNVVSIAASLGIELRCLFSKDGQFDRLASVPFAREFRSLEGDWRSIVPGEMSSALDATARNVRRSFEQAVKSINQRCELEVIEGMTLAETIAQTCGPGDIVAINEPIHPAEYATWQFQSTLMAALDSPAAVMLIPARALQQTGSIIAIAAAPDDTSIVIASNVAALAKARLQIIDSPQALTIVGRRPDINRERFIVVSRDRLDDLIATLPAWRRPPILIVEPKSASTVA